MTRIMNAKRLARMQAQQDRADADKGIPPANRAQARAKHRATARLRGTGYTKARP